MDIKSVELGIKFYKSPSNKQNMWIDGDGLDGERYEVRDIKDVNKSLMDYLEKRECLLQVTKNYNHKKENELWNSQK